MTLLPTLPFIILAVLLAELVLMIWQSPDRRRRMAPASAAGAGLVGAWLAASHAAPVPLMLLCLTIALAAHMVDIRLRW